MSRTLRTLTALAAATLLTAVGPAVAAPGDDGLREVLFVGNNWEGTADVLASTGDLARIGRIDVIPDKAERLWEIHLNPVKLAYFLGIRESAGEGHDQFVDDMYTTPDGSAVVVSRPSFADVVSIDLASGRISWRFPVAGYRSDHMAVSPDGTRVAVSASTANTVHVLDIADGRQLGSFKTGDKPHENTFSRDGAYLWNSSIGEVNTALDAPWLDWTKGDRKITVVDARTFRTVRVIDMRERLDAFGRPDLSDAVRPVSFSPDESKLYFQVSFFNGFLEYDVATDRITRLKTLPVNPATSTDRTTWVNDSRHHGMSMSPDGTKLCISRHHGRLRHRRGPRHPRRGAPGARGQAVLGHGERRRDGLRDLRERRRPGHGHRLRHRHGARLRPGRRPSPARPPRPRPVHLDRRGLPVTCRPEPGGSCAAITDEFPRDPES